MHILFFIKLGVDNSEIEHKICHIFSQLHSENVTSLAVITGRFERGVCLEFGKMWDGVCVGLTKA